MDIVLGSVIYSEALNYIDDFLDALKNQTVQDFDILLVNDNIDPKVLEEKFMCYIDFFGSRLNIINKNNSILEPYQLRIELLKIVKECQYELLILCDCDDKCAVNRVETLKNAYDPARCFFYNEIISFENERIMPAMPNVTDTTAQIQEQNYLGLSNTAVVMSKISNEFIGSLYEGKTRIFDWYLFSRMILEGGTGVKVEDTVTYYRIYENNLAGIPGNTFNELKKEVEIKIRHYEMLSKYNTIYEELLRKYKALDLSNYTVLKHKTSYWWGQLKG